MQLFYGCQKSGNLCYGERTEELYTGGTAPGLHPVHRVFSDQTAGKELSIPLFERIGHTVTLTNEGEKLLPLAQQILRLAAEATHISGNTAPEGLVRIAIAESLASWEFHSRFKDFMKISGHPPEDHCYQY